MQEKLNNKRGSLVQYSYPEPKILFINLFSYIFADKAINLLPV